MNHFTSDRFTAALTRLNCQDDPRVFSELRASYRETGRHYHTDRHISACLQLLDEYRDLASRPELIEVAIWFHDAVYDTRRTDNEARSAEWCRAVLIEGGASEVDARDVSDMILATKHHEASSPDCMLLIDIDLAILAAPAAIFSAFDQAIRDEHHWVGETLYRIGRRGVLERFVSRPRLYQTPALRERFEAPARQNIAATLMRLNG